MAGEYIGTIHTSDGEIRMHMPTVGDLMDLKIDPKDETYVYHIAAIACGVSIEKFRTWSMADACKALEKIGAAIKALKDY